MAKKQRLYYKSPYGVWLTEHDVKNYTPPEEKRAYGIFTIVMAVLTVVFFALGIFDVGSILGRWMWITLGVACLSYVMAVGVVARKNYRTTLESVEKDFHLAFNPERIEGYWFERSIKDTTQDETYGKAETQEPVDNRPAP